MWKLRVWESFRDGKGAMNLHYKNLVNKSGGNEGHQ